MALLTFSFTLLFYFILRNNIVISGIPDDISDNDLESTFSDKMKDADVDINSSDIEACHSRIGKSDHRTASKKTRNIVKKHY